MAVELDLACLKRVVTQKREQLDLVVVGTPELGEGQLNVFWQIILETVVKESSSTTLG